MINPLKTYTTDEYLEILRRRIWYIIIPFILVFSGAAIYTFIAPREYKASTLVLVTPQRVPTAFVQATVTSRVEERLQSIAQEVMSRTRLEQLISQFKLYEQEKKKRTHEEVVALMQKNIKVELPTKRDDKGYFTISYIGSDPNVVTTIVNRLTSQFIEENLKIREQQAVGTTEFISNELAMEKKRLDEMEMSVAAYKRRYMGELPEQRDTNLRILEQLQSQYQRVGDSLRAAMDRKLFIQKQMTDFELAGKEFSSASGSSQQSMTMGAPGMPSGGSIESQKESLTRALEDLRTRYTENHPDVVAMKKRLADLEKKKDIYDIKKDPRYLELKRQNEIANLEIKRLADEERSIVGQINKYRARVEQTPAREQDMASLMREYESTKTSYENLFKKSQEAQQAENLERRQKGEQFRIIDPARVPQKPFSPDIPKILLIGLLAGAGGGFGLAFFREQMDRSFHDAADVEISLGFKVLANIPKIGEKAA
jgi:polysaccharide chain length determinant protein (PEP-CTERM system associated)